MRSMHPFAAFLLAFSLSTEAQSDPVPLQYDVADLVDAAFIEDVRGWLEVPVVRLTVESRNIATIDQAQIDALDKQWRAETELDDQPLITSVLSGPLSGYLTRIQANSLGLFSEIFVMDRYGLNAGQSAITSDYWQGDEAKFQKTYEAGKSAVFIDDVEAHDGSATWRVQLNLTVHSDAGDAIGAVTVEINLTELARRKSALAG